MPAEGEVSNSVVGGTSGVSTVTGICVPELEATSTGWGEGIVRARGVGTVTSGVGIGDSLKLLYGGGV
ncbi:MAG: hypothetical protein UV59_C0023G0011 [Candidatus Gottesmanbacteria bacterium GW2011_GWA1_43_11]|uniref:Uncharacterized protein n=1 Tax=Candidatus Gottesmanbacteria bacterium GW2011_GWA1_43_11 TaxID=1618436 RepID=A0A0G1CFF3_9BACT|nr:MAG: hypothetical protein UV59_C0023G0011 [Candidatus Gottesmanbacteria bacterium GW2011_GWA1_43_11]